MLEQPRPVGPSDLGGVGDAGPQLERPAVVQLGLDRGVGQLRGLTRSHGRRQRLGEPPGSVPMVCQLGGGQCRILTEGQLRVGGQGLGDALVERRPLSRQEIVVHRLVTEGMTERVQLAGPHHQLATERFAQRRVDLGGVDVDGLAKQRVADPPADHRRDAQHLLRGAVGAGDALEDDVTDRRRQIVTAPGSDELLDEERVAVSPGGDPVEQPSGRLRADDPTDQLAHLLGTERAEVHLHGTPGTDELAEGDRQTAGTVAFGRPPRGDDQDARRAHSVGDEQQEVARRLVRPMQILDEDDERLGGGRGDELFGDPAEEPETIGQIGGRGDFAGQLIARCQVAEDLGERGVRNRIGERQAGPGEDLSFASPGLGDELADQP